MIFQSRIPQEGAVRILHILETADPRAGGPVEGARRFGEVWAAQGHVQDLVTLDPPEEQHLVDYPGQVVALGPSRARSLSGVYRYSPHFVPWLREHAPTYDAVIVSGLWRYSALGARLALARSGIKYFVYTHGMLDPWFRKTYPLKHCLKQLFWWVSEGPLLKHAERVLFTTEEEEELANNAFWPYHARGTVVGYGASDVPGDADRQKKAFVSAFPQLASRPFILFLSRIHQKKGCDLLLEAFACVANEHSEFHLVYAGPDQSGLTRELERKAAALGLSERVHFLGMIEGNIKWGAFRSSAAFALTSHQENFGVVVAEAMACGKPVLISNKVNIWREIESDGAGIVEPDTLVGSTRLLRRFLGLSGNDIAQMGSKARLTFESRYKVEAAADKLLSVITQR